jgi:hypothetical protein
MFCDYVRVHFDENFPSSHVLTITSTFLLLSTFYLKLLCAENEKSKINIEEMEAQTRGTL